MKHLPSRQVSPSLGLWSPRVPPNFVSGGCWVELSQIFSFLLLHLLFLFLLFLF